MEVVSLKMTNLRRHSDNAREKREYTRSEIADLAASIREHGLLQPLVVAPQGQEHVILAGHRRHAALVSLGTASAPCVVLEADEQESLAVLLGDNASHQAVDPLREAVAVAKLVGGLAAQKNPYDRAAAILGKSPSWVRGRMRLTALSEAWRRARSDAKNPVSQWPVGHLELLAALPETVQDEILEEWCCFDNGGVPLLAELKSSLSRSTCDLAKVPWDRDALDIVEGAPACSACPFRASAQGVLFTDNAKGDRCLNATCFDAKRRATVAGRVVSAREKYGEALRVETTFGLENIPVPEGTKVHREFDLVPRAKAKGGFPVLRLRTLEVTYMGEARATGTRADSREKPKRLGPKSLPERRADLERRRRVRAVQVFRGAMLGRKVSVGTEKHPEEVEPPKPQVPALLDVVALVLAYGTGPSIGDGAQLDARYDAKSMTTLLKETRATTAAGELATRSRLWNRVREPIARDLRILGPASPDVVENVAGQAEAVCGVCGLDWKAAFLEPAIESIPEPVSWAKRPTAARRRRAG